MMSNVIAVFKDAQSRSIGTFVVYRADSQAHARDVIASAIRGNLPELLKWVEHIGNTMGAREYELEVEPVDQAD